MVIVVVDVYRTVIFSYTLYIKAYYFDYVCFNHFAYQGLAMIFFRLRARIELSQSWADCDSSKDNKNKQKL